MSKIDLIKTVEEFNSSITNLNYATSPEINRFKQMYTDTKAHFDELNAKTQEAVNAWKESLPKTDSNEAKTPVDNQNIRKKVTLLKYAIKGVRVIVTYVSIIALIALAASSIYISSTLLTALVVYQWKKKTIDENAVSTTEKAEKAVRSLSHRFSLLLNQIEIIRRNRLAQSQNFKNFIVKFIQADPTVNEQVLLSKPIHALYLKYKFYLKEMMNEKMQVIRVVGQN